MEQQDGTRNYIKGYCCMTCSNGLLARLAGNEAREWEEEEKQLASDQMDVSDLQKRRLATFGSLMR